MSTSPPKPSIRTFAQLESGVHNVPDEEGAKIIREALAEPSPKDDGAQVWLDVLNPGPEEAAFLRDVVGFHPLAVEDCVRGRQRPKVDRYGDYLFIVLYAASINSERNRMALNEIHIFLGRSFIATVHDFRVEEVGEVLALWRSAPQEKLEVAQLAYQLFDAIVDDYFPVLEHFSDRAEHFESVLFERGNVSLEEVLLLRQELVTFRRIVAPQRDVVSALLRREVPVLTPDMLPYFQDVYDHIIRVTEEIDALRELISALLDAQFSLSAHSLNATMRTLTAWSIILMSMTLVAGVYGMNFRYMPELYWRVGYGLSLLIMAFIGVTLLLFFRSRKWL